MPHNNLKNKRSTKQKHHSLGDTKTKEKKQQIERENVNWQFDTTIFFLFPHNLQKYKLHTAKASEKQTLVICKKLHD